MCILEVTRCVATTVNSTLAAALAVLHGLEWVRKATLMTAILLNSCNKVCSFACVTL